MVNDPELAALIEQASRNLETLELLVGIESTAPVEELRRRLRNLREAYTRETDLLTRQVLKRAIDRRRGVERRKPVPVVENRP